MLRAHHSPSWAGVWEKHCVDIYTIKGVIYFVVMLNLNPFLRLYLRFFWQKFPKFISSYTSQWLTSCFCSSVCFGKRLWKCSRGSGKGVRGLAIVRWGKQIAQIQTGRRLKFVSLGCKVVNRSFLCISWQGFHVKDHLHLLDLNVWFITPCR